MLMMLHCAHGTKILPQSQSFSGPHSGQWDWYTEGHESHMAKAGIQNKKPLRTYILKTCFWRNHTDKRETQLCISPFQSERYCIRAFQMKMSHTKPSETLHMSLLLKKRAPGGDGPLREMFSSTPFKEHSVSCFTSFRSWHFRHLKTQGATGSSRPFEYNWRKPKTGRKETCAQQQTCSKNAGHTSLWVLVFTHTDRAYPCLCRLSFLCVSFCPELQYDGWFCFLSS